MERIINGMMGVACPVCYLPIRRLDTEIDGGCICSDRAERFSDLTTKMIFNALGFQYTENFITLTDEEMKYGRKNFNW